MENIHTDVKVYSVEQRVHSLSGASEVLSLGWNKVVFLVWKKIKTICYSVLE